MYPVENNATRHPSHAGATKLSLLSAPTQQAIGARLLECCLLKPSNCSRTNFGRLILQLPHLTAHTFACSVAHKQRCIELSISFMSCSSEAYSLSLWLPNYFSCSIACSRIESVLYSTSYLLFVNWSIKGEVRHCLRRFPRDVENIFLSP